MPTSNNKSLNIKPFLRWAGGKQWLSRELAASLPSDFHTYYEPFLGGGALFFAALPKRAILSDINSTLIETYQALRDMPRQVINVLHKWRNDKRTYYAVRDCTFHDLSHRAAQLLYLNRTCWNGLYRVNRQGKFNVPFGNHGRAVFDESHLLQVSDILQHADLRHGDFDQILRQADDKDFVYLDPPYTSLHSNNGFRQYNESLFGWQDQQRLARTALALAERGCYVVVSNADHTAIRNLYPSFSCHRISRHSVLAASSKFRRPTTELLLVSDASLLQAIT